VDLSIALTSNSAASEATVKVIAFDRFRPGVTMDTIKPLLPEEVAHAWRLWKRGIVRENYSRVDEAGVVLVFEVENSSEAMKLLAEFPMSRAGYLEWTCIPVTVPSRSRRCSETMR
jgi:muconolactone delta-isomerase